MADQKRRIALTKKISLADLSDGWQDCYAVIRPASYQDYRDFAANDVQAMTNTDQIKLQMDFVKTHFVGGKVMTFADDGSQVLSDMQAADIEESTELSNKLFFEIMGIKIDPKDLQTEVLNKTKP